AAKFTPRNGRVTLGVAQDGDCASVRVGDNGAGIPPQEHERIFEPFAQVGQSEHAPGGVGLGLWLARKLVELHDGRLAVNSEGEGHGAEFVTRLPLLTSLSQPEPANGNDTTQAARRRVLVVDDN